MKRVLYTLLFSICVLMGVQAQVTVEDFDGLKNAIEAKKGEILIEEDITATEELLIDYEVKIMGSSSAMPLIKADDPDKRLFTVEGTGKLSLENLILEGGQVSGQSLGGAIYTEEGTLLTLNTVMIRNSGAYKGGAIYAEGIVLIENSIFKDNAALYTQDLNGRNDGGAIYIAGDGTKDDEAVAYSIIRKTVFTGNIIKENQGGRGGAIYQAKKLLVEDCEFKGNDSYGGGQDIYSLNTTYLQVVGSTFTTEGLIGSSIYAVAPNHDSTGSKTVLIEGCKFSGYSYQDGGAIRIVQIKDTRLILRNSIFTENKGVNGNAVYVSSQFGDKHSIEIHNCTFDGNIPRNLNESSSGGAVYLYATGNADASITITGETKFIGNKSGTGGAVYIRSLRENAIINISGDILFENNQALTSTGGAIYMMGADGGSALIRDAVFKENKADNNNGGAIYIWATSGGKSQIEDTYFTGNSAKSGGAIYTIYQPLIMKNCEILENKASGDGGGIYVLNSSGYAPVEIDDSKFEGNTANAGGGAICNYYGNCTINNSTFTKNQAANGGAIYNYVGALTMLNVDIRKNSATTGSGGGIFNDNNGNAGVTKINLTNVLLAENTTNSVGGAMYNQRLSSDFNLTNLTIVGNSATAGGAIRNANTSSVSPNIRNSVIWGNTADNISNASSAPVSYSYSLVEGITTEDDKGNIEGIPDNAPVFLYTTDDYDADQLPYYGLSHESPGVDTGNNEHFTAAPLSTATDLFGSPRLKGDRIDMGAYEQLTHTAAFVGDVYICEGSHTTLQLRLEGTAPWVVGYRIKDSDDDQTVTITQDQVRDGIYQLTAVPVPNEATHYELTSVKGAGGAEPGIPAEKTEASIYKMGYPDVAEITGEAEVLVDETIPMANATTGGFWMVNKPEIASIDNRGNLLGVSEGVVDVWYVVYGSAPSLCETIATHKVEVKIKEEEPEEPEEPEVPEVPVDPEEPEEPEDPYEPDPSSDMGIPVIGIDDGNIFLCYTDGAYRLYMDWYEDFKKMTYTIQYSKQAKEAGFTDITEPQPIEFGQEYVTVPVSGEIPAGIYEGKIRLNIQDPDSSYFQRRYTFEVEVMELTRILTQPQSWDRGCDGEGFMLSVDAAGSELAYQWYFNDRPIAGANEATYEGIVSAETIGRYHVEVIGFCNAVKSQTVDVAFNPARVQIKWDDVLYIDNTAGRYVKFQWYKDGEAIVKEGVSVYYTDPAGLNGTYTVRAYLADGSFEESCGYMIAVNTRGSSVSVYPTVIDAGDRVRVESNELGDTFVGGLIEVYSLTGQKVYTTRIHSAQMEVPVTGKTGVYLLQVTSPQGKRKTEKVIVR